jgi:hypothetical protein
MRFQLRATGQVINDSTTDASNPPVGDYRPGLDRLRFAAVCEVSSSVSALTKDTGDPGLLVAGASAPFTCPAPTPDPVELMRLTAEQATIGARFEGLKDRTPRHSGPSGFNVHRVACQVPFRTDRHRPSRCDNPKGGPPRRSEPDLG